MFKSWLFLVISASLVALSGIANAEIIPLIGCSASNGSDGDDIHVFENIFVGRDSSTMETTASYSLTTLPRGSNRDGSRYLKGPVTVTKLDSGAIEVSGAIYMTIVAGVGTFEYQRFKCTIWEDVAS